MSDGTDGDDGEKTWKRIKVAEYGRMRENRDHYSSSSGSSTRSSSADLAVKHEAVEPNPKVSVFYASPPKVQSLLDEFISPRYFEHMNPDHQHPSVPASSAVEEGSECSPVKRQGIGPQWGQPPHDCPIGTLPVPNVKTTGRRPIPKILRPPQAHIYQSNVAFNRLTDSEIRDNNTPFLIRLPTLPKLQGFPAMRDPVDIAFTVPRQPTFLEGGEIPSFRAMSPETFRMYQNIIRSPMIQGLLTSLRHIDSGMRWHTSKFVYIGGTTYDTIPNLEADFEGLDPDDANSLMDTLSAMLEALRKSFNQGNPDQDARKAWGMLLEYLRRATFENIKVYQLTWKKLEATQRRRDNIIGQLEEKPSQEKDLVDVQEKLNQLETKIRDLQYDKCKFDENRDISGLQLIPPHFKGDLAVIDQYETFFSYINSDIDHYELEDIKLDSDPLFGHRRNHSQVGRLHFLGKLLHQPRWPWCPEREDEHDYCRAPSRAHRCDCSVIFQPKRESTKEIINGKAQIRRGQPWTVPLLHVEIHGQKGQVCEYGPFARLSHQCACALCFQERTFGAIIRKQDISLIEYSRDPQKSAIHASEELMIYNGQSTSVPPFSINLSPPDSNKSHVEQIAEMQERLREAAEHLQPQQNTIGKQLVQIALKFLYCIVDGVMRQPSLSGGLKDLNDQNLRPIPNMSPSTETNHGQCWYINDIQHLDSMMQDQWVSSSNSEEPEVKSELQSPNHNIIKDKGSDEVTELKEKDSNEVEPEVNSELQSLNHNIIKDKGSDEVTELKEKDSNEVGENKISKDDYDKIEAHMLCELRTNTVLQYNLYEKITQQLRVCRGSAMQVILTINQDSHKLYKNMFHHEIKILDRLRDELYSVKPKADRCRDELRDFRERTSIKHSGQDV